MRTPGDDCMVKRPVREPDPASEGPRGPHIITYCLICGVITTTVATAAGLAVSGIARLTIWLAIIFCSSSLAGFAYGSKPVNALWERVRQRAGRAAG
jgi:hypothetical protein